MDLLSRPLTLAPGLGGMGLIAGIGLALVGQAVSPFHVATHEFAQVGSIVAALVQLGLARHARRRLPGADVDAVVLVALSGLVGLGAELHGTVALANAIVHDCDPANTGAYFWATWLPLGALMAMVGIATARRRPTRTPATRGSSSSPRTSCVGATAVRPSSC